MPDNTTDNKVVDAMDKEDYADAKAHLEELKDQVLKALSAAVDNAMECQANAPTKKPFPDDDPRNPESDDEGYYDLVGKIPGCCEAWNQAEHQFHIAIQKIRDCSEDWDKEKMTKDQKDLKDAANDCIKEWNEAKKSDRGRKTLTNSLKSVIKEAGRSGDGTASADAISEQLKWLLEEDSSSDEEMLE